MYSLAIILDHHFQLLPVNISFIIHKELRFSFSFSTSGSFGSSQPPIHPTLHAYEQFIEHPGRSNSHLHVAPSTTPSRSGIKYNYTHRHKNDCGPIICSKISVTRGVLRVLQCVLQISVSCWRTILKDMQDNSEGHEGQFWRTLCILFFQYISKYFL